ncbi:MAG: hypothetical protein NVS4B3_24740 [Gemmatimonadaceae bacterium]
MLAGTYCSPENAFPITRTGPGMLSASDSLPDGYGVIVATAESSTRLVDALREAVKLGAADTVALRGAIRRYAEASREAALPPEQVVRNIKDLVARTVPEEAIGAYGASPHALMRVVVTTAIRAYYRAD